MQRIETRTGRARIASAMAVTALFGAAPLAAQDWNDEQDRKPMGDRGTQAEAAMRTNLNVFEAEKVMGSPIENQSGEQIGELKNVLVEPTSGELALAVVSGDELGEDRLVPWNRLSAKSKHAMHEKDEPGFGDEGRDPIGAGDEPRDRQYGEDRDDGQPCTFVLNADVSKLRSAPAWNEDELSANTCQEVEQHFGRMERDPGMQPAGGPTGAKSVVKVGKLEDLEIRGTDDDDIGDIDEVFLDADAGRVAFVEVTTGGTLGMGEKHVAVPYQALQVSFADAEEKELRAQLPMTQDRLAMAPEVPDDGKQQTSEQWLSQVYSFFQEDPYWGARARPAGFPREGDQGKDDDKKKKEHDYRE